jgi:hypothetical protein
MKNSIFFSCCLAILLYSACSSPEPKKEYTADKPVVHNNLYYANDLDNFLQWNLSADISKRPGHSGDYCSKTDSATPYSFGLNLKVSDLKNTKIKTAKISAWVKAENAFYEGKLVCSVMRDESTVYWVGSELKKFITKPGNWYEAKAYYKLPDSLGLDDKIAIYIWNTGTKSAIYADDFEIQFAE